MRISDLQPGTGKVELEAEVVDVEEPRSISKDGRELRVANATLRDDSGTIVLVLWNDNIDRVQPGSKVRVENGYVNTWRDQTQLTLGKFGKLTVLE